jgi:hypothetical protein
MHKIPDLIKVLTQLGKATRFYIGGIFAVGLIYFLFTGIEQGIDVVIQVGEYLGPAIFGILATILGAYLVWYSERYIGYIKQSKDEELNCKIITIPASFHRHIPRMLAVNCFASIQYAILCLPTFCFHNHPTMLLFGVLVVHNTAYFSLANWFSGNHTRKLIYSAGMLLILFNACVLIGLLVEAHVPYNGAQRHKIWLPVVALILLFFEVLMVNIFIIRRKYIERHLKDRPAYTPFFVKKPGKQDIYYSSEKNFLFWFNIVAISAVIIYFSAVFSMRLSNSFGPMAFALLASGVLVGLSNVIKYFSIRWTISIPLILLMLAAIIGKFYNPYQVRLITAAKRNTHSSRLTVKEYFARWIKACPRHDSIEKHDSLHPYDVYLVLSNGGASRAGDWTTRVLCNLEDSTKGQFHQHILSIAGASGGTVGNCVFYSLLKAHKTNALNRDSLLAKHAALFFATDFLTYTLGRMLSFDIYNHIIPLCFIDDRAAALADVMAERGGGKDTLVQHYFNMDEDSLFDKTGELPFLFLNSTRVQDGRPGVNSLTQLPDKTQRIDILHDIDISDTVEGKSIKLCNAAILSARFPYVSPAGRVNDDYFVDGGYFDNSGAGITLELMEQITHLLANDTSLHEYQNRLKFHVLHISNSPVLARPVADVRPLENDFLAPVLTLIGLQSSTTKISDGVLTSYLDPYKKRDSNELLIEFNLYNSHYKSKPNSKDTLEEDFPMSWVTSDYQLWRMEKSLRREDSINYKAFQYLFNSKQK